MSDTAPMRVSSPKFILALLITVLLPLNGLSAEVYFSPRGGAQERIQEILDEATTSIDVAMYGFTSPELAQALARARDRGVRVRVLLDRLQAAGRSSQSRALRNMNLDVRLDRGRGIMHHKVALIDQHFLIGGSYNWTKAADRENRENCLVLTKKDNPDIFNRYQETFEQLWQKNGNRGTAY